jgi:hypothetical protein
MRHNPVERIAPMVRDAGFVDVSGRDVGSFLFCVLASRPDVAAA